MKNILILCLVCLLIIACATSPVSKSSAKKVPQDRLFAFQHKTPKATSNLVISRDTGISGSPCYAGLFVNGVFVARFDTGEISEFYIEPGEVVLKVGKDPHAEGICSLVPDYGSTRETILRAGESKFFRILINASGVMDIQRSDNDEFFKPTSAD